MTPYSFLERASTIVASMYSTELSSARRAPTAIAEKPLTATSAMAQAAPMWTRGRFTGSWHVS
jgi:hypothetical protein